MPPYQRWASDAQRRWGNSPAGHDALGDDDVAGRNRVSKGRKVPARKGKKPHTLRELANLGKKR